MFRKRGHPEKVIRRGRKKMGLVALIEEDVGESEDQDLTSAKESSPILPEAQGIIGALTRAMRA